MEIALWILAYIAVGVAVSFVAGWLGSYETVGMAIIWPIGVTVMLFFAVADLGNRWQSVFWSRREQAKRAKAAKE